MKAESRFDDPVPALQACCLQWGSRKRGGEVDVRLKVAGNERVPVTKDVSGQKGNETSLGAFCLPATWWMKEGPPVMLLSHCHTCGNPAQVLFGKDV